MKIDKYFVEILEKGDFHLYHASEKAAPETALTLNLGRSSEIGLSSMLLGGELELLSGFIQ